MNKVYLGDGVYVNRDGFGMVLTTENGIRVTNKIVLEPQVFGALMEWVNQLGKRVNPSTIAGE